MFSAVLFDMFETLVTLSSMPPYFGRQMAEDAGIAPEAFLPVWQALEDDRTLGRVTLSQALFQTLTACGCYTPGLAQRLESKRIATKKACFERLHPGILPMLSALRAKGLCLGLISNCYDEEAAIIRSSTLFPYFDAVFLSCEKAMKKPDAAIFTDCAEALGVKCEECLYIGDGGSNELAAAQTLSMHSAQALWYIPAEARLPAYRGLRTPQEAVALATTPTP